MKAEKLTTHFNVFPFVSESWFWASAEAEKTVNTLHQPEKESRKVYWEKGLSLNKQVEQAKDD